MRDHRRGIVLLSTLLSVLLLAALAAVIQQRVTSNLVVMARLERDYRAAPSEHAILERLRGILGDAVSGLPESIAGFNVSGTPFVMEHDGRTYEVRVNDSDGLIDAYLASPAILALLPPDMRVDSAAQQAMLRSLPPGQRYPVLPATLAQLGLNRAERLGALALTTQSSENGQIRVETAPDAIRSAADGLSPLDRKVGQMARFQVDVREMPPAY
jgi:hypothetical protein